MSWTLVSFPHTVPPDWHTGMQASPVSSHASRIAIVTSAHPLSIGKTQSKVKVANTLDPPSTTTPPCKKEKKITDIMSESTDSALANSSKWSKYEENKSLLRRHFQKRLYTVYMEQGITWRGKKECADCLGRKQSSKICYSFRARKKPSSAQGNLGSCTHSWRDGSLVKSTSCSCRGLVMFPTPMLGNFAHNLL